MLPVVQYGSRSQVRRSGYSSVAGSLAARTARPPARASRLSQMRWQRRLCSRAGRTLISGSLMTFLASQTPQACLFVLLFLSNFKK